MKCGFNRNTTCYVLCTMKSHRLRGWCTLNCRSIPVLVQFIRGAFRLGLEHLGDIHILIQ